MTKTNKSKRMLKATLSFTKFILSDAHVLKHKNDNP